MLIKVEKENDLHKQQVELDSLLEVYNKRCFISPEEATNYYAEILDKYVPYKYALTERRSRVSGCLSLDLPVHSQ